MREKLRDAVSASNVISRALAESIQVSTMAVPVDYECAAVSSERAVRLGIVRELVTMEDYANPQQWAETIQANSFEGSTTPPRTPLEARRLWPCSVALAPPAHASLRRAT